MLLAKSINILENFFAFINFQTLNHQTESLILLIVIPLLVLRRFKIPLLKIGPLLSHHPSCDFIATQCITNPLHRMEILLEISGSRIIRIDVTNNQK